MYEDTPDQEQATIDVKRDMERPVPMDRLICGDVGFGKTEVAMRAASLRRLQMVSRWQYWCLLRCWPISTISPFQSVSKTSP